MAQIKCYQYRYHSPNSITKTTTGGDRVPSAGHPVGGWVIFTPKKS